MFIYMNLKCSLCRVSHFLVCFLQELEKLGPEGKDGIRCPEASDEGRQEERASPSSGSTYSSRSSPTKDVVAPASEPEGVAPPVHPSIVVGVITLIFDRCCFPHVWFLK